jgi:hypothetical protein
MYKLCRTLKFKRCLNLSDICRLLLPLIRGFGKYILRKFCWVWWFCLLAVWNTFSKFSCVYDSFAMWVGMWALLKWMGLGGQRILWFGLLCTIIVRPMRGRSSGRQLGPYFGPFKEDAAPMVQTKLFNSLTHFNILYSLSSFNCFFSSFFQLLIRSISL